MPPHDLDFDPLGEGRTSHEAPGPGRPVGAACSLRRSRSRRAHAPASPPRRRRRKRRGERTQRRAARSRVLSTQGAPPTAPSSDAKSRARQDVGGAQAARQPVRTAIWAHFQCAASAAAVMGIRDATSAPASAAPCLALARPAPQRCRSRTVDARDRRAQDAVGALAGREGSPRRGLTPIFSQRSAVVTPAMICGGALTRASRVPVRRRGNRAYLGHVSLAVPGGRGEWPTGPPASWRPRRPRR